jgi:cell division protein FtsL
MFWGVVAILFIIYIIYSLSTIKYQLSQISKHLNIKDVEDEKLSNEEIEKELEEDLKR